MSGSAGPAASAPEAEKQHRHQPQDQDGDAKRPSKVEERSANAFGSDDDDEAEAQAICPDENAEEPTGVISRVVSRLSGTSLRNYGPPPDGGWRAWTVVLCSHLIIMNTWGIINSFGAFQKTYETLLAPTSASAISWIGSIQVFLVFFIGTFTGRLTDAGLFRPCYVIGASMEILGTFTAAQSTRYWQLLLSQGFCLGIGNGFLFCPSLAIVNHYFLKKRGVAFGIVASGSATGALIFPAMVQQLIPKVGLAWTLRAIGFIQVGSFAVAGIFMKPRLPPRRTGALVDWDALRDPVFRLFAAGLFFAFFGVYFAFWYLATYSSTAVSPPFSYSESINLLLVLNGLGIPGRILPNQIGDRWTGPMNVLIMGSALATISVFSWAAVRTQPAMYGWTVVNGLLAGSVQGLLPSTTSSLTNDPRKGGVRLGMVFTIISFAVLTAPPAGGAIIERSGGGYTAAICFMAAMIGIGTCFLFTAKLFRMKQLKVGFWSRM